MMVNGLSPFHIYQALFIIDRLTIINLIELPNDIQIRHIMLIVMQPRESRTLARTLFINSVLVVPISGGTDFHIVHVKLNKRVLPSRQRNRNVFHDHIAEWNTLNRMRLIFLCPPRLC